MRVLLILLTFLVCSVTYGQDIIVRVTGDTIHVNVESSNETFVYYTSASTKRGELDVISRKEIAEILYNVENVKGRQRQVNRREARAYELIQVYLSFQGCFLPNAAIPEGEFKEYYTVLQYGSGFRGGLNFYFNEFIGIGATYSKSSYKNSIPVQLVSTGVQGNLSDDIRIQYLGTGAVFKFNMGEKKTNFTLEAGAGINFFNNDAESVYGYNLKGQGLGIHLSGAFNLNLGGGLYLPLKVGYIGNYVGNLTLKTNTNMPAELKNELEDAIENQNISVTRLSLGAGLLFAF